MNTADLSGRRGELRVATERIGAFFCFVFDVLGLGEARHGLPGLVLTELKDVFTGIRGIWGHDTHCNN